MTGEVDLKQLIEQIIRGGWPGSLDLPLKEAALLPAEYLNAIIDDDAYRIDGIKRNTEKNASASPFPCTKRKYHRHQSYSENDIKS